jgi:hypothetical protein
VPGDDVANERDDGVDLGGGEVGELDAWRSIVAHVHDLDADGARVELGVPTPKTLAGMPGAAILVDHAIDGRRLEADEVMAADPTRTLCTGEGLHRTIEVELREVKDQITHPAIVISALIAGIDKAAVQSHRRASS